MSSSLQLSMQLPLQLTAQILESNRTIANEAIWLAVLWHAAALAALVFYLFGWRPTRRAAGQLLALPVVSVGVLGLVFGSPFNGIVFGGLAVALTLIARRMPDSPARGSDWQILTGHTLIGFGLLYPHFLDRSPLAYVVAAPFGVLPCPTLVALVGFTLIAGGFSKAWNLTLAFFTVFYGTVGVMQLGVWIDIVLVIGAVMLAYVAADLMYRPVGPTSRVAR